MTDLWFSNYVPEGFFPDSWFAPAGGSAPASVVHVSGVGASASIGSVSASGMARKSISGLLADMEVGDVFASRVVVSLPSYGGAWKESALIVWPPARKRASVTIINPSIAAEIGGVTARASASAVLQSEPSAAFIGEVRGVGILGISEAELMAILALAA